MDWTAELVRDLGGGGSLSILDNRLFTRMMLNDEEVAGGASIVFGS